MTFIFFYGLNKEEASNIDFLFRNLLASYIKLAMGLIWNMSLPNDQAQPLLNQCQKQFEDGL